jgi:hypothetical protein
VWSRLHESYQNLLFQLNPEVGEAVADPRIVVLGHQLDLSFECLILDEIEYSCEGVLEFLTLRLCEEDLYEVLSLLVVLP